MSNQWSTAVMLAGEIVARSGTGVSMRDAYALGWLVGELAAHKCRPLSLYQVAAGPQHVLVVADGEERARELAAAELGDDCVDRHPDCLAVDMLASLDAEWVGRPRS